MSGAGHTPGPLAATRELNGDDGWMVVELAAQRVATASYCTEGDARLYAAAPELLEALQKIVSSGVALGGHHRALALAAIAKAEGQ